MSILLVDSDSLCYRAGFVVNEPGQESLACHQLGTIVKGILEDTGYDSYQLFLSGSNNFRYNIYPDYKGNRVDMKRPLHLQTMREYLVSEWGATISDGNEADDTVGIALYAHQGDEDIAIAHVDKDLDSLEGRHYNYTKKTWYDVSSVQAIRHFYYQLIMGDRADNIPGYDGKMRHKVPQFLQPVIDDLNHSESPEAMLDLVSYKWGCDDEERWQQFNQAAHCLWIQRKEWDDWRNYLNDNLMEVLGLPVDLIRSLPAPFEQPVEDGHQSLSA